MRISSAWGFVFCAGTIGFSAVSARGQVTEKWRQFLNTTLPGAADEPVKVVADSAGDLLVLGTTTSARGGDILLRKYHGDTGAAVWEFRYDGPASGNDTATDIAFDTGGNIFITGTSADGAFSSDFYAARLDPATGAAQWQTRYVAGHTVRAMVVDNAGDLYLAGFSQPASGIPQFYLVKLKGADGGFLWQRTVGAGVASAITLDAAGHPVAAGYLSGTATSDDYALVSSNALNGAARWMQRSTRESADSFTTVSTDTDGNILTAGSVTGSNFLPLMYSAKHNTMNGVRMWENTWPPLQNEYGAAACLASAPGGHAVVTGVSGGKMVTLWLGSTGAQVFRHEVTAATATVFGMVIDPVTPAGAAIITGKAGGDVHTGRYSGGNGPPVWERRYNGPAGGTDEGRSIALLPTGDAVIAASSSAGTHRDWYVARYGRLTGDIVWDTRFDGPANGDDFVQALALSRDETAVAVAASSSVNNYDWAVAVYEKSDGRLRWRKSRGTPAGSQEFPAAVQFDSDGNVVVCGRSNGAGLDLHIVKYAAADGEIVWQTTYAGDGTADALPAALEIDAAGDVYVAGAAGSAALWKRLVLKCAGQNGQILWAREFQGPSTYESVWDMALDPTGLPVVAAASNGVGTQSDFAVAKYDATTGDRLWEYRYDGPAHGAETPTGVCVAADGSIGVCGHSSAGGSKYDRMVILIHGTTGTEIWNHRYQAVQSSEFEQEVQAASDGDLIVTGASSTALIPNIYTTRHARNDGAVRWENRSGGFTNSTSSSGKLAMALDTADNPVLCTRFGGSPATTNFRTAKLSAATGSLLWELTTAGPGNDDDRPRNGRCLVLTAAGFPVIGGFSRWGAAGDYDAFVAVLGPVAPVVTTGAASSVRRAGAMLGGQVNPSGRPTEAAFEYGTTAALGSSLPATLTPPDGTVSQPVTAGLAGLLPGATYHFRLTATSDGGNAAGQILTFTTLTPFADWRLTHTGNSALAPLSDTDSDGIPLLIEYALGLLPDVRESLPSAVLTGSGDEARLQLFLTRNPERPDVTVEVEAAGSTAGPWEIIARSSAGQPFTGPGYFAGDDAGPGLKTVEVRDPVSVSGQARRFLRLRVSQ